MSKSPILFSRQPPSTPHRRSLVEMAAQRNQDQNNKTPPTRGGSQSQSSSPALAIDVGSVITQTDSSGVAIRPATPYTSSGRKEEEDDSDTCWDSIISCCLRQPGAGNKNPIHKTGHGAQSCSSPGAFQKNNLHDSLDSPRPRPPKSWPKPQVMPKLGAPLKADRKCLVLDLDETLVHSSFQYVPNADYRIPVEIDGQDHDIYVLKRPGVDEFMRRMAAIYEIVIYTASLSKYADPLLDKLDIGHTIEYRLFREHCVFYDGHFVKDLSVLTRKIENTIIVDNSPQSYTFHPDNAIDCSSYIEDPSDTELWQIADFLEGIKDVPDVSTECRHWRQWCKTHPSSEPRR